MRTCSQVDFDLITNLRKMNTSNIFVFFYNFDIY